MQNYIEERNYWNDRRVRATIIDKGQIIEEGKNRYLVVECGNGDIKLLCKWGVCPTCRGEGTHVNPSIDASGLTADDFYEDPGFADDYMSGVYDQPCNDCNGRRVVPEVDRDNNSSEMIERYDEHLRDEYEYAAIVAAERARGC